MPSSRIQPWSSQEAARACNIWPKLRWQDLKEMFSFGVEMGDGTSARVGTETDCTIGSSNKHLTTVMLSDVRLDAQPKDSFQLFHSDSSKKQRDEMISCAHVNHLYWQFQPGKNGVRNTNLVNKFLFLLNGLKALSPYFHASLTQRLLRITKKQSEDSPFPSINLRNFVLEIHGPEEKARKMPRIRQ